MVSLKSFLINFVSRLELGLENAGYCVFFLFARMSCGLFIQGIQLFRHV